MKMDPRSSSNMRISYGDGSNKVKAEPVTRVSASVSTLSSRAQHGGRTRSEPLAPHILPSKTRCDARPTRASVPASQKHDTDHATGQSPALPKSKPPEIHFAVLGAEGSGKSTFVQCALDLKKPATSPVSSKKMSLEGDVFLISLAEVPMEEIEVVGDQIYWPDMLEDVEMPQVDGILVVCDVTERRSVKDIPKLLGEFIALPVVRRWIKGPLYRYFRVTSRRAPPVKPRHSHYPHYIPCLLGRIY